MPDAAPPTEPGPPLAALLVGGVTVHAVLPIALAFVHRDPGTTVGAIVGLHVAGALAIAATGRWWWARPLDLAILLVADHATTFFVGTWVLDR